MKVLCKYSDCQNREYSKLEKKRIEQKKKS